MYRDNNHNKYQVNIQFTQGGLGDCLARLPAVEYIIKNYPHITQLLWVPDYFYDIAKRSLSKGVVIRKFSENKKYKKYLPGRTSDILEYTNLASHMTDHAFHLIVNKTVEDKDKNSLPIDVSDIDITRFNLPDKYVVVSTGFTAEVRELLPEYVNHISQFIVDKGYTPVFLGKTETFNGYKHTIKGTFKEEIDYTLGLNLVDQTTLLETTAIIYGAKTIVGLDNGLLHLATTHPTLPVVGGFTTVDPKYRMAYRNNQLGFNYYPAVPPASLECRFCQSNMVFEYDHSFTSCFYKDKKCISDLHSSLYINELDKIL